MGHNITDDFDAVIVDGVNMDEIIVDGNVVWTYATDMVAGQIILAFGNDGRGYNSSVGSIDPDPAVNIPVDATDIIEVNYNWQLSGNDCKLTITLATTETAELSWTSVSFTGIFADGAPERTITRTRTSAEAWSGSPGVSQFWRWSEGSYVSPVFPPDQFVVGNSYKMKFLL